MDENVSVGDGSLRGKGRKNMKGNRTDIGWRYGTDVVGDAKRVKCNFVQKSLVEEFTDLSIILPGLVKILNHVHKCQMKSD
ncbi:unnamed protein product [Rhodiola kirilowii]